MWPRYASLPDFQMCLSIVLTPIRQRAHLASWHARDATLTAMADEVDVKGIVAVRRNDLLQVQRRFSNQ